MVMAGVYEVAVMFSSNSVRGTIPKSRVLWMGGAINGASKANSYTGFERNWTQTK
jgi:hypothetical protein